MKRRIKKAGTFKLKQFAIIALLCLFISQGMGIFQDNCFGQDAYSPIVRELHNLYKNNPKVLDTAFENAVTPPTGVCSKYPGTQDAFCWKGKKIGDLLQFFENWLNHTPTPHSDGFGYYQLFYDFCYRNPAALEFVETEPWLSWTQAFTKARGEHMDGPVAHGNISEWKKFLGSAWNDYKIPEGGFKTFNEFFTRELRDTKPSPRPISGKGNDAVLVAPADSLINVINSNLTATTEIKTKYDESLNIRQLLAGSKYADKFIGGTAVSCVLLPTVYHWYHSPVAGEVIESKVIQGTSFGMHGKFYTFENNGNFGGYKSDFGVFGIYHRGYFIIQTNQHQTPQKDNYGLVAMIPVGLDDVNSINFIKNFEDIPKSNPVRSIEKGAPLGFFAYGGSVVILLFEKGRFHGLKVQQGQQVGILD